MTVLTAPMAAAAGVRRSNSGTMAVLWGMVTLKPRTDKARKPRTAVSSSLGCTGKGTYTQFMSKWAKARLCMRGEREWATGQPMMPTTAASPERSRTGRPPPVAPGENLGQKLLHRGHRDHLQPVHPARQVGGVVRRDQDPLQPRPAGPVQLFVDAAHGTDKALDGHLAG